MKVVQRDSSFTSTVRSDRNTGIPAAFASRSTGSHPDSTIGEKAMMSTLRAMNDLTAAICFSGCPSESTKTRSIPACRAAVLMESVFARRQLLSAPVWAKPSTMR